MSGAARPAGLAGLAAAFAFPALALLALAVQLAPLAETPPALTPDLFWCVLAYFTLRAPRAAPLGMVAVLCILRDALLGGPFGAGALSFVLASELLRRRAALAPAPRPLWSDWAWCALGFAAATALQWALLLVSFARPPSPAALAPHVLVTALALPVVAALLRYALRLGASPRPERST
ncbi:MAG: hypothetical protein R6V44_13130 [Paracoccaceae bacterium]